MTTEFMMSEQEWKDFCDDGRCINHDTALWRRCKNWSRIVNGQICMGSVWEMTLVCSDGERIVFDHECWDKDNRDDRVNMTMRRRNEDGTIDTMVKFIFPPSGYGRNYTADSPLPSLWPKAS